MVFGEDERQPVSRDTVVIAVQDRCARGARRDLQPASVDGQARRRGETHEVVRVRERICLVEIVDAPDEAAFVVAPCAEVLGVQIADSEDLRCARKVRAACIPLLHPAIERGAQERERADRHLLVLERDVSTHQRYLAPHPGLVVPGGRDDRHKRSGSGHDRPMFAQLTILVLAGSIGPLLAYGRRGLVPVVIGELLAGFVLGRTGFGVIDSAAQPLPVLSGIGFAMLMFTAGTHVDIGSPAIRQGFVRGVLGLAVVAVTAIPIGLLLDHSLGVGHPALIAVIITGSSAAIAFPIIEERKLSGPNVAFLIAWVALADSVTVVIMPLTLASGSPLEALGGDAAIVAAGVLVLVAGERLRRAGV